MKCRFEADSIARPQLFDAGGCWEVPRNRAIDPVRTPHLCFFAEIVTGNLMNNITSDNPITFLVAW
jgi:hypothetical protein